MNTQIFTTDPERRVDSWNRGAEALFGYSEAEMIGELADILFTAEDLEKGDAARELQLARDTGYAQNERWHAHKDGSKFYGSGSVMPLRDRDGKLRGFVKIMRDLTESKRSQEAISEQLEELKRFNVAAVDRETRMIELKEEVNALCARLEQPPRYRLPSEEHDRPASGPPER